jgi:hypothetical protein
MNNRLCKIRKPFVAHRQENPQDERQFQINETVWYDMDQTGDSAIFVVDNDPWIVGRQLFLAGIEQPK